MTITTEQAFITLAVYVVTLYILFVIVKNGVSAGNKEIVEELKKLNQK